MVPGNSPDWLKFSLLSPLFRVILFVKSRLEGLTLQMTVLGNNNQPLKNQLVTLHSQRPLAAKTNSKGIATFYDVAPGLHHLQIVESGKTLSEPVYVTNNVQNNKTSAPQQAAVGVADVLGV